MGKFIALLFLTSLLMGTPMGAIVIPLLFMFFIFDGGNDGQEPSKKSEATPPGPRLTLALQPRRCTPREWGWLLFRVAGGNAFIFTILYFVSGFVSVFAENAAAIGIESLEIAVYGAKHQSVALPLWKWRAPSEVIIGGVSITTILVALWTMITIAQLVFFLFGRVDGEEIFSSSSQGENREGESKMMTDQTDFHRADGSTVTTYWNGDIVTWRGDVSFHLRPDGKRAWISPRGMMFVDRPGHRQYYPQLTG